MSGYTVLVVLFNAVFSIFFRAIQVRGSYKIPREGPVIFVAAPHANQFVDPMMIIINCWLIARRKVSFLIAESSFKHPVIGRLARMSNAIPVGRVQDTVVVGKGEITADGTTVTGKNTQFTKQGSEKHYVVLGDERVAIEHVESDTKLTLVKPFNSDAALASLKDYTAYKFAEKVDHKKTFQHVFSHLAGGGCLGIFPEGGSHDRTDLLPMKNGVSIMALGTLAQHPELDLKVVPVGLNYFHPHKFRSRAIVEFGTAITPSKQQVERYKKGGDEAHEVVKEFLDQIQDTLKSVTVSCPDYETLQLVQACRRLYRPQGDRQYPLSLVTEFTRRMVKGYELYKDNPKIIETGAEILKYNKRLHALGLRDHQVPTTRVSQVELFGRFVCQLGYAAILLLLCVPGFLVNIPLFVATKLISRAKAATALRKSTVKVKARDVIATWKVLVGLWFIPTMYTCYSFIAARYFVEGSALYKTWIFCLVYGILILVSSASIKIGDSGADNFKILVPLFMALSPRYSEKLEELRGQRQQLVYKVTEIVNEMGPAVLDEDDKYPLPWSLNQPLAGHFRRVSSSGSLADFNPSSHPASRSVSRAPSETNIRRRFN